MTYQTTSTQAIHCGKTKRNNHFECNDAVARLNELGLQKLQDGKNVEAKQSFARALSQSGKSLISKNNNDSNNNNGSNKNSTWPLPETDAVEMCCSVAINGESDSMITSTTSVSSSIDKSLYIYQREQYDEGVHVHREALHIDSGIARPILDATLMYNVGQAYVRSQHYKEAKRWFGMALSMICNSEQQSQMSEAINSYTIQHNLGYCSYCLGENEEAMVHYQEALNLVGTLGLGKTDMAAACNAVAVMHFHNGPSTPEKALELLNISITIYRCILGDSSPQVATCLSNQGRVYYLMNDFKLSLSSFHEALTIRERVLGADSIDVLTAIFNMGQTYQKLGSLLEAKKCYTHFLKVAKVKLGTVHRDVAAAFKSLADVHREERDFPTALSLLKESLESGRAALGHQHPELVGCLNDLGSLSYEMNSYEEALEYFQECLAVQRKVLDEACHPHLLITLLNIAQIQKQSSDLNAAFETYREIYALQAESSEKDTLEVASTVSSMGLMKYLVKDFTSALNFYLEALRLRRLHFGEDAVHADIASTLNSIGLVYFKLNHCAQANETFMECMKIRQALLGPNHRDVAILFYNIATVLIESGDDEAAMKFYKESLRVERIVLGQNHPEIAQTLRHLGQVHQEQGKLTEALKLFTEAVSILQHAEETKDTVAISQLLNLIGDIHLMHGEIDKMMICFAEACNLLGQDGISLTIAGRSYYDITRLHPPCAPLA